MQWLSIALALFLVIGRLSAQQTADTIICSGQVITLSTDESYEFYDWAVNPSIIWTVGPRSAVNPFEDQRYTVVARRRLAEELVLDGDFEMSPVNFFSDLAILNSSDFPNGSVSIVSNSGELMGPHDACPDLSGEPDATFLAINGIQNQTHAVWCQEVEIVEGTTYGFRADVATLSNTNGSNFAFTVDGVQVGNSAPPESISCTWRGYLRNFEASTSKRATICITHTSPADRPAVGAIDKISFRPYDTPFFDSISVHVVEAPDTSRLNVSVCDDSGFEFEGIVYPSGQTHEIVYPSNGFCDSILLLSVEKVEFLLTEVFEQRCSGDEIELNNGQTIRLMRDTSFVESLRSSRGCDSLIEHTYQVFDASDVEITFTKEFCTSATVTANVGFPNWPEASVLWPDGSITDTKSDLQLGIDMQLEVSLPSGCSFFYSVTTPSPLISPEITILKAPSCFSTTDGSIKLTSLIPVNERFSLLITIESGTPQEFSFIQDELIVDDLSAGNYTVTLRSEDGCEVSTSFTMRPPQAVQLEIEGRLTLSLGESSTLELLGAYQYGDNEFIWTGESFNSGSSITTGRYQEILIPRPGIHQVKLQLDSTCAQVIEFTISITNESSSPYPNAFSPNGDATNDIFRIGDHRFISEVRYLRIFNRWGNLVHNGANTSVGWSPTNAPIGVYVYESEVLFVNGDIRKYIGDLHLLY